MNSKISGIDWLNHAISFLSALIGIFIAFQLEDYQDSRQEEKELEVTMNAVKLEIESNMAIYQANVDNLSAWLKYYELVQSIGDNREVRIKKRDFLSILKKGPNRFDGWTQKRIENDSILIYNVGLGDIFRIDVAPETGISTSSWQAGLYSGTLNKVGHEKLSKLSKIYEWTSKDIGLNEREFYGNLTSSGGIDNTDDIVVFYSKVAAIDGMKLKKIKTLYEQIDWDN